MEASVPFMQKCETCEDFVEITTVNIGIINKNFGGNPDCQKFLRAFKTNPDMVVKQCYICLCKKWKKTKTDINELTQKSTRINNQTIFDWISQLSTKIKFNFILFITIIISILVVQIFPQNNSVSTNNHNVRSQENLKAITELSKQLPSLQSDLLKNIHSGFVRLKTNHEPFVLLLLHDNTNKQITDCLASYTSIVAKQNIFTHTNKSLLINASEWAQYSDENYQDFLYKKLFSLLKENEVLVLENLQDLPWSLAKLFHTLCDAYYPAIANAMFIFELKVNHKDFQQLTNMNKLYIAENTMNMIWIETPASIRGALITRLTSVVDAVLLMSDKECSNKAPALQTEELFIKISPTTL